MTDQGLAIVMGQSTMVVMAIAVCQVLEKGAGQDSTSRLGVGWENEVRGEGE